MVAQPHRELDSSLRPARGRAPTLGRVVAWRTLVPLNRAHRAALLRSGSDAAVGDATGRGDADGTAWVDRTLRAARLGRRSGHRCDFAVLDVDAGCVGVVGVRFLEPRAEVGELSYWIEAAHRGRGHATSACRRAVRFAFEMLGARVVKAHILLDNAASRRVLVKLGFRSEAGETRYVLTPEDLAAPSPADGDTELLLTRCQRDMLRAGTERRRVRGLVAQVTESFPRTFAGAGAADLEAAALGALARARSHGLDRDHDLAAFVELALLISPRFDEHPAVVAVLCDARVAPDRRMATLLATLPDDAWDEASRLC